MLPKFSKQETVILKKTIVLLVWIILLLTFLRFILPFKIWVIIGIVLPGLITVAYTCRQFLTWRYRSQQHHAAHCERMEKLMHDMIDLAYIYDNDHTKFYFKFIETVSIESLSQRGIINPDALLNTSRFNHEIKAMTHKDAELLALLMAGFSGREIKIIYGLKNMNSVYIKCYRLRGRLSKRMKQLFDGQQHNVKLSKYPK